MGKLIKDNRLATVLMFLQIAFSRYKFKILILSILGVVSGVLEGIGINAIVPLLSFVVDTPDKPTDFISVNLDKIFGRFDLPFNLKSLLIFICLLFVVKAIVLVYINFIRVKITATYEKEMRTDLFTKTLNSTWPYLLKQKVGYLDNVLIRDVNRCSAILNEFSKVIIIITSMLIYILVAFNISVVITLITLSLGALVLFFFKPLIYKIRKISEETSKTYKEVAHHVNENIIGMKTIKSLSSEAPISVRGKLFFERLKNLRIKTMLLQNITTATLQPISIVFICIIFAVSYLTPDFNLPVFIVLVYLIQRIFIYFQSTQTSLHKINEAVPFFKSAVSYQKNTEENRELDEGQSEFKFNNTLELEKVSFSYDGSRSVLADVSFKIKKGEMIGLIGPSGAGKTTMVDLLLRLFQPTAGRILLDGQDITKIKMKEWRNHVGYVSQDIFLINDTIENNIKFLDKSVSNEDMFAAAKMANIYDFIQRLPNKFSTSVGERGLLISGGQRQRIILARALARKPKILILDEATSALDNESEVLIQNAIKSLKGRITVLIIAHRLSTVLISDKLIVLRDGQIIEQGMPSELLENKDSYFYKVYNIRG